MIFKTLEIFEQNCERKMSIPYSVPIEDIIGDTSHIISEVKDISVRGLTLRTWKYHSTKIVKDSSDLKPPVIGIHGGPAFTHRYILPLKLLADRGYDVILYDQGKIHSVIEEISLSKKFV